MRTINDETNSEANSQAGLWYSTNLSQLLENYSTEYTPNKKVWIIGAIIADWLLTESIASCFKHARFITQDPTVDDAVHADTADDDNDDLPLDVLKRMATSAGVYFDISFDHYITINDGLITTTPLRDSAIIRVVTEKCTLTTEYQQKL